MPCVSVLFPCICHFLPWAVWCLVCLYISCTVIASIRLDTVNTNHFYGEKLKQAVYEPRPHNTCNTSPLQISPLLSPGVLGTPTAAAASAAKGGSVFTPPRLRRTPAGGGETSQHKKTPTPALKTKSMCYCICNSTVDREIFTLKIILMKNFRVVKFLQFHSICGIFLMVDDCNMNEHLESSWL